MQFSYFVSSSLGFKIFSQFFFVKSVTLVANYGHLCFLCFISFLKIFEENKKNMIENITRRYLAVLKHADTSLIFHVYYIVKFFSVSFLKTYYWLKTVKYSVIYGNLNQSCPTKLYIFLLFPYNL